MSVRSDNQETVLAPQESKTTSLQNAKGKSAKFLSQLAPFVVLIVLMVVLSVSSANFLTLENLLNVLLQISVIGIIAVGMTFVMITAGIDLSVGSLVGLTGIVATLMMGKFNLNGWGILIAILAGIVVGMIFGWINGFLSTTIKLPPFIATLGMMEAARGLAYVLTGGVAVYNVPQVFNWLGQGQIFGVPIPVYFLVLTALAGTFLLKKTKLGLYTYAIGSNPETARMSGIKVSKHIMIIYALSGLLSGLAGVILASRTASGQPTAGTGYELDVIAACVIGGTSLFGGQGTILGTMIGAALMGLIRNGSTLLGISAFWQLVVIGVIIWLAVAYDSMRRGGVKK